MATKVKDIMLEGTGLHSLFKRVAAEAGLNLVSGSFEEGGTLSNINDVLLHIAEARYYSWGIGGTKEVPAGSTPETTGGIGAGAWVDRTDLTLRSELIGNDGLQHVFGKLLTSGINRTLYAHLNDFKVSVLNATGVVADGVTDVRAGVESLILTLSSLPYGATIYFPKGKYLLNSYSSDNSLSSAFSQILPIRSNIHIELDDNAELVVGDFFDDKNFTLFCGLDNAETPKNSSYVVNSTIRGGTISFSGSISKMRTGYKLRIGVQFGKSENTSVLGVTFKNGDLSNCIVGGFETYGKYHTVKNCRFIDLVQDADSGSSPNNDFTACYCAAEKSKVIDCDFHNTSRRGKEVAAAVELHKSYSNWSGGSIYGYTRGSFIVATSSETARNQGCAITNVRGVVTNQFVGLWIDAGCVVADVDITLNNIRTLDRDVTMSDPNFYGACGIISTAGLEGDTGTSININVSKNVFSVSSTVRYYLSTCIVVCKDIYNWSITGNIFQAKGFMFNDSTGVRNITALNVKDNKFNVDEMVTDSVFADFDVYSLSRCNIDMRLDAPVSLSCFLKITALYAGSSNTIKVHDENTSLMSKPVVINETFLSGATNYTEYPQDLKFFIPATTGIAVFNATTITSFHSQATLIDKKTLPADARLCGQFTNSNGEMGSIGYFPTNKGGSSYVGRVRLSSFK